MKVLYSLLIVGYRKIMMDSYMNNTATTQKLPIDTYSCQVKSLKPLSANAFQVELASPPGSKLGYKAGQYLQLKLDLNADGQSKSFSYSIANSFNPRFPNRLQIFIQNRSSLADEIIKCLAAHNRNRSGVNVILPMGRAFLQTDLSLTHLLVASGSGISKIKCLTEELLKKKSDASVNIYWSNKNVDDFYLLNEFQAYVDQHENTKFTPILEVTDKDWSGRSGYIYDVIKKDFERLDNTQTYLCGSPQMVYGTIDQLKYIGLKEKNCYSDVFEYAPRD